MEMKPKQLIRLERGHESKSILIVDETVLNDTLRKVGNSRVAVVSVTGSPRSGKSYFLNYVLRRFSWEEDENDDWMGWDNTRTELQGFDWRGGKDVVTSGIWIWSEPLWAKTRSGEVIALLLIDTQGTLNEFTTEQESTLITSLCLLVSSITIYNVKNEIEQENLQLIKKSLQLCSEILQGNCNFQDLLFTVRDWRKDNGFEFGTENGTKYLKEKLAVKPGLTEDARFCRELIRDSFKSISCTLFPDPGEKVKSIAHKGYLAEVDPLFSTALEEIPDSFNPDTLYSRYTGKNSTGFLKLFRTCIALLNDHQVQVVQPIAHQQSNSSHLKAFEMYKSIFEKHPGEFFGTEDVKIVHENALSTSARYLEEENSEIPYKSMLELKSQFNNMVNDYYQKVTLESEEKRKELQNVLKGAMDAILETYTDEIKIVFSRDTVSEKQMALKHKFLKEDGISSLHGLIPKKYRHLDFGHQIEILETEIDEEFSAMKRNWETKKRVRIMSQWELGLPSAIDEYKKRIRELMDGQSFLEANTLKNHHEKVQKFVLDKHCNFFEYGDYTDEFQIELKDYLNKLFLDLDRQNNEKMIEAIEGKLGKALAIAVRAYREDLSAIEQDVDTTEENFVNKNELAKEKIRSSFLVEIGQEPDHIKTEFLSKLSQEFEQHSKISIENIKSATVQYLSIIEAKRKQIQAEALKMLENYVNSNEIFTEEQTEVMTRAVIEQSISKFDDFKKNTNVPASLSAAAQGETIDFIKNKTKYINEKGQIKITDYKLKVNRLVESIFISYKSIMDHLEDIDSEELLVEHHGSTLKDCVQQLKSKCVVKDEDWVAPFVKALEEKIDNHFNSDVKKVFLYEFHQNNFQLNAAKMEAIKLYREEMENYFSQTPFTKPADLQLYHSKLCSKISKTVTTKLKLKRESVSKLIRFLTKDFETYANRNKMNTPTDDPAIGIDLGTTYTCVAIYDKGETRVIPNEKGSFTFPSYITFTRQGELVGHPAKEAAHVYPQNTIFDAKRLIGRRFNEDTVQRDIKNWPFEVVNEDNAPKIKVQTKYGEKIMPPEQISAKILNHVKVIAERHLGKQIKKAVITVPAYFNDGQRQATRDAGEIAGLEVLQIINEPTAAAMAYHLSTRGVRHERNVLVYDLGGGTFDVVVLNMKPGGSIEVKSVNGDTHLGGEDFDDNLLEEMIKRYKAKHGVDLSAGKNSDKVTEKASAARILRRLRHACERTKINISGGSNTSGEVNVAALVGELDLLEPVTRKEFEDLNMDLFLKTLDIVTKALEDAHLEKGDIHDIVLVGGSTRIPKVQEMLIEYFDGKILHATVNPDEAVACGAAVQAAILNGNQEQILKNISLQDVTPLSLGVELFDDSFSPIIKRNSQLPADGHEDYQTAKDYQDQVAIAIYEGEERVAKDNHLLGKFILKGIPKNKRGVEKILVNMEVDKEGILKVTALCVSTGAQNNITIEDNRGRLSTEEKRILKEEFD